MAHRTALKAALVGALMAFAHPASAADLDLDEGYDVGGDTRVIVKVHNRGFRHCHWIDGDRVCHRRGVPYAAYYDDYDDWDGPYDYGGYGYGYGWGPGVVLGFGGRGYGYGGGGRGGHRGGHGGGGHGGGMADMAAGTAVATKIA